MDVIEEGGTIAVPTITSREYVPGQNGVVLLTRVPSNIFTFEEGQSITISGVFKLGLAGSGASASRRRLQSGRRLQTANGLSKVPAGADVARFQLAATLGEALSTVVLVTSSANHCFAFASQAFAAIGAVFLLW